MENFLVCFDVWKRQGEGVLLCYAPLHFKLGL